MKINDYYREAADISLNGGLIALFPVFLILMGNLFTINNQEIMVFTIPFFFYSVICFQLYLFRKNQAITIRRTMAASDSLGKQKSLFEASHLLVLITTAFSRTVHLYFPDGHLAGTLKKCSGSRFQKTFALSNLYEERIAYFRVKRKRTIKIDVFDKNNVYIGSFERKQLSWRKKQKLLLNGEGRCVGEIEGSSVYMDEKAVNQSRRHIARLRRGWMPVEWSHLFPEPNTPVLSFTGGLSENDKLLWMSFLIYEYFVER